MNRLLQLIVLIFFNLSLSQTFYYDLTYTPNSMKKDSAIHEKTVLDVWNGKVSVYRTKHEKRSDSLEAKTGLGLGRKFTFEDQFYTIKKDGETKKSIQTIYKDIFFIKVLEKLNWKILPEKNKIGEFQVQKAIVHYGGRNWTAWFTTEIPVPDGPYIFSGLPGLIIKISDDENNFLFNLSGIKNLNGYIYYRTKGTSLKWDQLKQLSIVYYSDPLARIKLMGLPLKQDEGNGNVTTPDMKIKTDRIKKTIRENNNPIELNHKIIYK